MTKGTLTRISLLAEVSEARRQRAPYYFPFVNPSKLEIGQITPRRSYKNLVLYRNTECFIYTYRRTLLKY